MKAISIKRGKEVMRKGKRIIEKGKS